MWLRSPREACGQQRFLRRGGGKLCGVKAGDRDGAIGKQWAIRTPAAESVTKPRGIVADREIRSIMGAATFLPAECAHGDGQRDLQQELYFQRLNEVGVEDLSLVLDAHLVCSDLQGLERGYSFAHGLLRAEDAEVEAHGLAEIVAYLPGSLGTWVGQQGFQPLFLVAQDPLGNGLVVTMPDRFRGSRAGPTSEDDGFEQRVASQTVGSMHAQAGAFAGSKQPRTVGFPPGIGFHAAHLVVGAGSYGNGGFDRIESSKLHRQFSDLWESFEDAAAAEMPKIQQDTAIDPSSFLNFLTDGQGDSGAGRQLHLLRRVPFHEPLSKRVQEIGAFASGAFRDQDPGILQCGWVKLHELHVFQRQPCLIGQGHAIAGIDNGVRAGREDSAAAAGGEDHCLGAHRVQSSADEIPGNHPATSSRLPRVMP